MSGNVSGASSIQRSFNYDGNTQGGRTAATDAAVTVVGIGLATGQYVKATATIARSTSNSVSLVAALERNYANP
jgi:transposase-like protein